MSTQRIPAALRAQVRERAGGGCEYCRVHEDDVAAPHEPDHVIAEQHGGLATDANLAFACYHCKRFKGTNLAAVDPQTGDPVFLFNPHRDQWAEHFKVEGARIVPLSATGRATAALLRFNASERLATRELLHRAGRYPAGG